MNRQMRSGGAGFYVLVLAIIGIAPIIAASAPVISRTDDGNIHNTFAIGPIKVTDPKNIIVIGVVKIVAARVHATVEQMDFIILIPRFILIKGFIRILLIFC